MAQPPYQDPNYPYPPQDPYGQQPDPPPVSGYPPQQTPYSTQPAGYPPTGSPPPPSGPPSGPPGGVKKRQYAAQAFEFGSGANAALTPSRDQVQGAIGYAPGGMAAPVGYPPADTFTPAPVGGYVPPQPAYDTPGVAAMTNQFGQMGFAGHPAAATQLQLQVC